MFYASVMPIQSSKTETDWRALEDGDLLGKTQNLSIIQ